jgi:glycerate dehydrogenase
MKIVILDAETLGGDLSLEPLREIGDVVAYPSTKHEEIAARVADCDILVQNKVKIDETVFSAAPRLRLICEAATGYDNIDLAAARAHGVAVCNVPGYSTPSVVQLTLSMVLSLATNLPAFAEAVANGAYTAGGKANILTPVYHELAGKTWGIVGYGNIGRGVGAVAEALECRVVVSKRTPCTDAECVSLDELCRMSDIITVHTPLSAETRGLIDRRRIEMMKNSVIFVNVARGAVTDEAALAEALTEGRIGGLGVDVFSEEPLPESHPFYAIRKHPNICLTPHMAWGSFEARTRCLETIASNARVFLSGGRQNRID